MQRTVPVAITMAVGCVMVAKFFFEDVPALHWLGGELEAWATIIAAMAFVLGLVNLLRVNGRVVLARGRDWPYKLALLAALLFVLIAGIAGFHTGRDALFHWMYEYVFTPLSATMFSLLAFFIASAAFRAFRARTWEAGLLLAAGVIVMLGRVPLGNVMTGGMAGDVSVWILNQPGLAGQRAIVIGAALGMTGAGVRILLGIERPYLR